MGIGEKIRKDNQFVDDTLKNLPLSIIDGHTVGPLDPNCALPEDDFSPYTVEVDSTAPSRDRIEYRLRRAQQQSDFTSGASSSTAMLNKLSNAQSLGSCALPSPIGSNEMNHLRILEVSSTGQ